MKYSINPKSKVETVETDLGRGLSFYDDRGAPIGTYYSSVEGSEDSIAKRLLIANEAGYLTRGKRAQFERILQRSALAATQPAEEGKLETIIFTIPQRREAA